MNTNNHISNYVLSLSCVVLELKKNDFFFVVMRSKCIYFKLFKAEKALSGDCKVGKQVFGTSQNNTDTLRRSPHAKRGPQMMAAGE